MHMITNAVPMLETVPAAVPPICNCYTSSWAHGRIHSHPHCYWLPPPSLPPLPCSSDPASSQLLCHSDGSGQQVSSLPGSCKSCKSAAIHSGALQNLRVVIQSTMRRLILPCCARESPATHLALLVCHICSPLIAGTSTGPVPSLSPPDTAMHRGQC